MRRNTDSPGARDANEGPRYGLLLVDHLKRILSTVVMLLLVACGREASRGLPPEKEILRPTPRASKAPARPRPKVLRTPSASSVGCRASWYSGARGASGAPLVGMFAAHKTAPFHSNLRVTNTNNGNSVTVKVLDRGPFIAGRCVDLAPAAFAKLAPLGSGTVSVRVERA